MTNIQRIPALLVFALALSGGIIAGVQTLRAAPVRAQALALQANTRSYTSATESANEPKEFGEPTNEQVAEKNLAGGGHADSGEANHQFEGVE